MTNDSSHDDLPGLRIAPLMKWLAGTEIGLDLTAPLRGTLLAGGRSNVSYLLTDASGRRIVLRRPPLGHVMPTAHDMGREYRVLSGLNQVSYPAPTALAHCEDDSVIGASFMLMDFVDGLTINSHEVSSSLSVSVRDHVSSEFITTLADLHAVDVREAGLQELGRPEGYLGRQLSRWQRQWELSRTREMQEIDELIAWLEREVPAIPADRPWSLVHGDYRLDNMILSGSADRVLAVLDWEMSTLGDPVLDLGVVLTYWSRPGEPLRHALPVAEGITDEDGFWDRAQLVEAYADRSGRNLDTLDVCTALACFKLSVIMESIHKRTTMGQQLGEAADQPEADMGKAAQALAQMGLAVTRLGALAGLAS